MLVIPGVGDFEFEVDSEGEETVVAVMAPEGYGVDDDHPDKAAWKDAAGLEVEMKLDKIESKSSWNGRPLSAKRGLSACGGQCTHGRGANRAK